MASLSASLTDCVLVTLVRRPVETSVRLSAPLKFFGASVAGPDLQ